MKFVLTFAHDYGETEEEIIINSLNDLKTLEDQYKNRIVIDFYGFDIEKETFDKPTLIVLNDYLE